jgi:hypothetical protein
MGGCGRRYDAIIDLTRQLNSNFDSARETQLATRGILNSLFPRWLPPAFKVGLLQHPATDGSSNDSGDMAYGKHC